MTNDELYEIIKDNYTRINKELSDLNQRVKSFPIFQNDYENWKTETKEWREHICKKIDIIKSRIETLPCPDRAGKYESLSRQVTFIWGILFLIVAGVITRFFR